MRIPPGVRRAFRLPRTREQIARDLDDEVRFHLESRIDALERAGVSPEQARAEALRRFGDVSELRDYCMSMEVARMTRTSFRDRVESLAQDLGFALRQLRRARGFAAVTAATLALGIGATTAIFSVVDGVVLRPLPFDHPERLVQVWGIDAKGRHLRFADPTFDRLTAASRAFSAVAEYNLGEISITDRGDIARVPVSMVSKRFFDVLGVRPALGRFFAAEEQQPNAPLAVVISHRLWAQRFGGSPGAIGATMMSGTTPLTVVGVLPAGLEFPAAADVWMPRETRRPDASYTAHNWLVIARTRPGVTPEQAARDASLVLRRLHADVGDATWTFDGTVVGLRDQIVGDVRPLLLLSFAASAVLLLIACANVANLLIARLAVREGEVAVRMALGAGRGRMAQQLGVEATLLAALGGAGGLALAAGGMRALLALRPDSIPRLDELHLDWRMLAFALALSAGTALALGLVGAWRAARGDLRAALSQSQRTQAGGGAGYRVRGSLVVVQIAMTVVLLVGAGLLVHSFVGLIRIDPGFRTRGIVVAGLGLVTSDSTRVAQRERYVDDVAARARSLPGVTSVGFSGSEPFSGGSSNGTFLELARADVTPALSELMDRFQHDKEHSGYADYQMVDAGYFRAMAIPLRAGRLFDGRDRAGTPHVAVINAALARKQWPHESAIGKVIEFGNIDGDLTPITIVGVVGDTREQHLAADAGARVYVSLHQRPGNGDGLYAVMATDAEGPTAAAARQVFRQVRADVPMRFTTIERIVGRSLATQRFMLLVLGVFGAVALLLATLGVYSVISYLVAQRGREISIRVALGATAPEIVRLVLRQGVALALVGALVGGATALASTRVLATLLYGVSPSDPVAFAAVLVLLGAVALLASWVPARRAARVAPMDVLRGG